MDIQCGRAPAITIQIDIEWIFNVGRDLVITIQMVIEKILIGNLYGFDIALRRDI